MKLITLHFTGFLLLNIGLSDGLDQKTCPRGCYELHSPGKPTLCDCCNQQKNPLSNPCLKHKCPNHQFCILREDPNSFPLLPQCRNECREVLCPPPCVYIEEADGCPACYCNKRYKNPCENPNACASGEECYLLEVKCSRATCRPLKKCRLACPPPKYCPATCLRYIDVNGCEGCHCCNACVSQQCQPGSKCVLDEAICIKRPCPTLPRCVSNFLNAIAK